MAPGICKRFASHTPGESYYYHTDHLGGLYTLTKGSDGTSAEFACYYPFGGTRVDSGSANLPYKFTGQELDPETKLYNFNARQYHADLGRFISPDSIVPSPGDPQTLNRYSYCRNNPQLFVDPTGHFFLEMIIIGAIVGAALGTVTSAISGTDIGMGALTGAITGGFLAGAGSVVDSLALTAVVAVAAYAAAGASAGAINAGISGSNVLEGTLWGGAFGAAVAAMPTDLGILKPFPSTELGTVGNRIFGSAVMGAGIGALHAGMTGGDIGHGAWMGAATWAASQAFLMGAGHIQGRLATGHWYDQFDSGTETWYYYKAGAGAANYGGGVVVGDYTQIWYSPNYPPGFNVWAHEQGHNWQDMFNGPADWVAVSVANSLSIVLTAVLGPGYSDAQHSYNPYETIWMPYHAGGL